MNKQTSNLPSISVIIPTLNEANSIGSTLDSLRAKVDEVIVVDAGSDDATVKIARERGAKVISSGRGRGLQMHTGARAARGNVLWFLHADTCPDINCAELIRTALQDPAIVAGNFEVRWEGDQRAARFLSWFYPQLRRFGVCYGDSAIFVRHETYKRIGGFQPFPIFEDLDLISRLRREGRVAHLAGEVTTSSRRFEGRSFARVFVRWLFLQVLYWLGVHPNTLGKFYTPVRKKSVETSRAAGQTNADKTEA